MQFGGFYEKPVSIGMIFYVREAWRRVGFVMGLVEYKASMPNDDSIIPWKSPMFMPRKVARIFLKVTGVRVERLQDISREDVCREGIIPPHAKHDATGWEWTYNRDELVFVEKTGEMIPKYFLRLWDSINAKRDGGIYAWNNNPWVYVIEFERVDRDENI